MWLNCFMSCCFKLSSTINTSQYSTLITWFQESEILENQNHDLKTQIQELETQRRRLVEMLNVHGPTCTKLSDSFTPVNIAASYPSSSYQSYTRGGFRRVNTFPRATASTLTYRRVEMTSVETYQSPVPEDNYCRGSMESSAVYHNFDNKDSSAYCRSVTSVESPPTYTEQYPCQTVTSEQFVKPELPSMGSFHNPSPSYHNRLTNLDMASPNLAPASAYRHYDEESDTFSSGFSPTSLDGSCLSGT